MEDYIFVLIGKDGTIFGYSEWYIKLFIFADTNHLQDYRIEKVFEIRNNFN